jgi:hypothetical protein
MTRRVLALSNLLLALGLTACLAAGSASVGGALSGLPASSSVTLQNNGGDNLTLSQNGNFTFAGTLDDSQAYAVTVLTQPASATCTVTNGSGNIDSNGNDVTNVSVTCATTTNTVSGAVSGLASGAILTLANNGGNAIAVSGNTSFAFPGTLTTGTLYSVTVVSVVPNQTCTVTNGSGTFTVGTPTNVVVTCV